MNPDQLWETTMNPEDRTLAQVTVENAKAASNLLSVLMGDDVPPRKQYIVDHAKRAEVDL